MRLSIFFALVSSIAVASIVPCADELVRVPLEAFLEQSLQGDLERAERLQVLVGLRVEGSHRHYPGGRTTSERRTVRGIITAVFPVTGTHGLYALQIEGDGGVAGYAFSASASPNFPRLDAIGAIDPAKLALFTEANATPRRAHNLLDVGLDTPPVVHEYTERLRAAGAIAFYGSRSAYAEFSNFYEAPLVIDDELWPTSEHYFQAMKFMATAPNVNGGRPYATEHVWAVRKAPTPADAARMGRDRTRPLRPDWEAVKEDVMRKALLAKFTQHPHLLAKLLETGDAPLVEHTERDTYWGDGEDGTGKSRLGPLLMELRASLRVGRPQEGQLTFAVENALLADELVGPQELRRPTLPLAQWVLGVLGGNRPLAEQWGQLSIAAGTGRAFSSMVHTSSEEWCQYLNGLPLPIREVLAARAAEWHLSPSGLKKLNVPEPTRVAMRAALFSRLAGSWAGEIADAVTDLNLSVDETRGMFLASARRHADGFALRNLPKNVVDDAFVQQLVVVMNEARWPCALHCTQDEADEWRGLVLKDLIESAAAHGLHYRAVYANDGAPFNPSEHRPSVRGQTPIRLERL